MTDPAKAASDLHNELAGKIVASIVRPAYAVRGSFTDILVLTESVLVGVCLTCVKLGGDEKVLDVMVDGARQRLAEIRLKDLQTEGRA
ncbi:MAG: hypothetical protein AB7I42_26505 [Bradyrhizobium sp.]|uniref:hypothetical protein n=1 Tax=Bradyrhizobium sp. TaxID=376 RepID=UPI003D12CF7E